MRELSRNSKKKTAILVRCTTEEADLIRRAAAVERRTLSGFILNSVMNRLRSRADLLAPKGVTPLRRKEDLS